MDFDGVRMLAVLLAIGSGVWVGGVVTVAIVSSSTQTTVAAADRIALFRVFGRRFASFVAATAVLVVLPALALATLEPAPITWGILVLAVGLLPVIAVGIVQARRMTSLRSAAASGGGDPGRLRRNAAVARVLRSLIGLMSLGLPVLAVLVAERI
ncbi:uncharacterized membrane protein (DUF441 family) [Cryobacterium mesophilum]|uniref:DUF1772 domain-containing protein n=1 Tax=Terrimesophilobacter mesophilus TaxID=433647 RepID=A0A4R8VB58_9MICO|nr:hypothetical protein [Terrimesophilobacter mesophilus]MBB5632441.1 uncharacterized membrane protein (DUF441 family) [Terrimesophilobacter mesophilus]TFB79272.1 hypothetical protein E3N84_03905 [Terrimesophilobacter mesophilus]